MCSMLFSLLPFFCPLYSSIAAMSRRVAHCEQSGCGTAAGGLGMLVFHRIGVGSGKA